MLIVVATAGCTVFGKPFGDPGGDLSLIGPMRPLCKQGRAMYFGQVRNTGPLEVRDATAIVDVYGAFATGIRIRTQVQGNLDTFTCINKTQRVRVAWFWQTAIG